MKPLLTSVAASAFLVVPALAAEPIASTDDESPGLSLQVTEFKISDGTVMLKFAITNDSDKGFYADDAMRDLDAAKADGNAVSGIYLVDVSNKKKHFVVADTNGHCLYSRDVPGLGTKQSENLT